MGSQPLWPTQKKVSWFPLPIVVGYKISKVKEVVDLNKDLDIFHFGEINFYINDSHGKFFNHCVIVKFHSTYVGQFCVEEEMYRWAQSLEDLPKRKKKGNVMEKDTYIKMK